MLEALEDNSAVLEIRLLSALKMPYAKAPFLPTTPRRYTHSSPRPLLQQSTPPATHLISTPAIDYRFYTIEILPVIRPEDMHKQALLVLPIPLQERCGDL